MNARFFAPDAREAGTSVELPVDEGRHLATVLRLAAGDSITVFNGRGLAFAATVEQAGRARVVVRLLAAAPVPPEPAVGITLVQAVLKGDRMDDVVRDAVMMGVTAIHPVVTERVEVSLAALIRSQRQARWQRIAVSSAKQCGRAFVPVVTPPVAFAAGPGWSASLPAPRLILVEPGALETPATLDGVPGACPAEATVIVGPEGGWGSGELTRALEEAVPLVLGRLTLRADAAVTVAVAALLTHWKAL